jgi:hypothetical protein
MTRWSVTGFALLIGLPAMAAGTGAATGQEISLAHSLVLFMHQLLFVYWLGPDIGISIWSRKAANPDAGVEQRITAGKMMTTIDIVPRICLSLMLTVGGILSEYVGVTHPLWQMIGIVLLGPVWLTLTLMIYLRQGTEFGTTLERLDGWLRWILVISIVGSTGFSWLTGRLADTPWLAGKLLLLAVIILLGLIMRARFRGFYAGLARLESEGVSDEINAQMVASHKRGRPFGHAIWLAMLAAALLGVAQPGSVEAEPGVDAMVPAAADR